ncbi:integrin beta-1-A-like [Xenia sp. Carnegie-2017]|uniref:integrin beta-1-A-like n=1 Tax=Xenia sp. Carnegie-2017 TaxID=2897299 RepID=UPI001F0399A8|nr:integrin beta-1-A-like [Xenia sp. Carnegie-2017]
MLMDMSYSMKDNLPSVETLGLGLDNQMRDITSRFRVGFGTMVDKPLAPFCEVRDEFWAIEAKKTDIRPYSSPWVFRNALPLTDNTNEFEQSVKGSNLSQTLDGPDCWPDTLMQVAVCEKDVGWSPIKDARRLVVIAVEDDFHIAGDGLLGGIVTPNDGKCKLGNDDVYLGKQMDYPSLSHLRKVLLDQSIVPIFAVDENSIDIYNRVVDYFGPEVGAEAGVIESNSTNIVELIRSTYEKIGTTQTVFHNVEDTKNLKIEYEANCLYGRVPGQRCENVTIGETVNFTVSITLEQCPPGGVGYSRFSITTALGDKIPVIVKYLCDCDCSNNTVHNATECSKQGSITCGDCKCNDGFLGDKCDCADSEKEENSDLCRKTNTSSICSGNGQCACGKCICNKGKSGARINGKFCECNDEFCDIADNGERCGGVERGECKCGRCKCKPGWEGSSCSCRNITSPCVQNNVTCSGHGKCLCGNVFVTRNILKGCIKGCSFYKDCVRCKIYQTGPLVGTCEERCNTSKINNVPDVKAYESRGTTCVELDEDDDCTFSYILNEGNEKVEIFAESEKRCPREEGYLLIIIGVILGIVAIGAALLLIWKLLATIQDRREFAKFEREQQNARYNTSENPIYKTATTTFQNPTYGGKG